MKRHRNHVLEDLSLTALKLALPDVWVVHSFCTDYGIDVQIEIFEENGNSTGLRIYGQLKATDNSEDKDVLQLDREHFEYWARHTDPVALFRYYAESNIIKWCWMHELEWRMRPSANSLNVCSYLRNWQTTNTAAELLDLARIRSKAIYHSFSTPLSISVKSTCGDIAKSVELADRLAERLPTPNFEVFGEVSSQCHFEVILDDRRVCIGHMGLPGFVATVETTSTPDDITEYALILLFLVAARYDRTLFLRGASPIVLKTMWSFADDIIFLLTIEGLIRALGADRAIPAILENAPNQEHPHLWFAMMTAGTRSSRRFGEMESWRKQLKNWADTPVYSGMAATAAYNYANHLANAGTGQWEEAEKYYLLAGTRDSIYYDREYYWAELGAARFEAGNYKSAADAYRRSLDISPSAETRWRLGDAYFHNGNYELARTELMGALASEKDFGSYPLLVLEVCNELLSRWHITKQTVTPITDDSHRQLSELKPSKTEASLILELQPFINLCAIDPLLSFNCGHLALGAEQPHIATFRFLTCALRQRNDAEAWALAFGAAMNAQLTELVTLIAQSAYFYTGENFVAYVMNIVSLPADLQDATKQEFKRRLIELIRSTKERKTQSFLIRVFNGEEPTMLHREFDDLG